MYFVKNLFRNFIRATQLLAYAIVFDDLTEQEWQEFRQIVSSGFMRRFQHVK